MRGSSVRFTPHTLPLHSVFTAHNTHSHVGFFVEGGKPENPEKNPRGTGENNTSNKLNSHMILPKPGLELGTLEVRGE